jgi:peptide/nickel transport system permease protein
MLQYTIRRTLLMIPTLFMITVITFIIIQLPPGDYLSTLVSQMSAQGEMVDQSRLDALKVRYGLDQPWHVQYWKWMSGVLRGDLGVSFEWNKPVRQLIGDRLLLTFIISFTTMILGWALAFPIGIYSAVKKYSIGDYLITGLSFVGVATPNFLLAPALLWVAFAKFNTNLSGLFSSQYLDAPWSVGKVLDMLKHLWVPLAILCTGGIAGSVRILRANLLDEMNRPYVTTARAKGLSERKVLLKYPIRLALNPFVSTIGWQLPNLISGVTITAIVLGLPTTGPLLLSALKSQDMYLAGSFLMILSALTIIGTFLSDILLGWLDPRIRYARGG